MDHAITRSRIWKFIKRILAFRCCPRCNIKKATNYGLDFKLLLVAFLEDFIGQGSQKLAKGSILLMGNSVFDGLQTKLQVHSRRLFLTCRNSIVTERPWQP